MNWDIVTLLYWHELRMLLRARRTVVMAIVVPLVVMPVMLFGSKFARDQRDRTISQTTYTYAVTGSMADRVRTMISRAKESVDQSNDDDLALLREFKFRETPVPDPRASLEHRDIYFYIQTYTGDEADAIPEPKKEKDNDDTVSVLRAEPTRLKSVPLIRVVYRGNNDASSSATRRMQSLIRVARRLESNSELTARGFDGDPENTFNVETISLATAAQVTGSDIGRFMTVFLVMLMLTGGSIAAIDIVAGEKERGTIETLLTTAANRADIVTAKQMAIFSVAIAITLIQFLNFVLYLKLKLIALPRNFVLDIPVSTVLMLLSLYIPLAATIAAVLLMISAYSKTYKEAQMYFFPVYMVSLIPSLAAVLPAVPLRSAIVLVPLANVSVAAHEIMMGRPDYPMILVTYAVMVLTAAILTGASTRLLAREDIIIPAQGEPEAFLGGSTLFRKRVLRWFVVMWAVIFAIATNVPQLATFRAQLLFNEFVIFGGASLLMLRIYRLNVRETLSLRSVKWPVWIAVILAAPAGNVMGVALFKLLSLVLPVPQAAVEQMSAMMPKDIPTWQMYLYVGLIPGFIEELVFRGILLNGLRRKIRPYLLPLVIGIIFGMFHFTLFRIGPTAFLGVLLTIIAMLTGSVFPGIILHVLNNSFAVWASNHNWPLAGLENWHYAAATLIFGLTMWIIYRNRYKPSEPPTE